MTLTPKEKAIKYCQENNLIVPFFNKKVNRIFDEALDIAIKEEKGRIITLIMSQPCNTTKMAIVQKKIIELLCNEDIKTRNIK